jgi:hypothetical protein
VAPDRSLRLRAGTAGVLTLLVAGCDGSATPDREALPSSSHETTSVPGDPDLWLSFDSDTAADGQAPEYRDAAGNGHLGRVVVANGGSVEAVPGPPDHDLAVAFPSRCTADTGCPRALVEVPADPSLDPGMAPFAYGASVWLAPDQTSIGSNIVQKGRFGTTGGQWKLQIDGLAGEPSCVVRSGGDVVTVRSSVAVADRRWHRVVCRRDAGTVSIDVDGTVDRKVVRTGSVESPMPVRVGSPGVGDHDDQFHGRIDDVFLVIDEVGD